MFKGILIEKTADAQTVSVREIDEAQLPKGNVTVKVDYSTVNYKDGLAITGKSPVVRTFPMVPGVDFAGTVEASDSPDYKVGDAVVLNGWGVGEKHWGGLAQKARVDAAWLVKLPAPLSARDAMALGTAGYTAMLSVIALENHGLDPKSGPILVTGASGGVGGYAIAILAALGFSVIASTGRPEESDYLKRLGATEIIGRDELSKPGKPLSKERWAGAIDSVGSHTLANACASTKYGGAVASCGLAQGMDFPASVAPFILRGVSLLGIDSVMRPKVDRDAAWARLATIAKPAWLTEIVGREVSLEEAIAVGRDLLDGKVRGRVVVDVNK